MKYKTIISFGSNWYIFIYTSTFDIFKLELSFFVPFAYVILAYVFAGSMISLSRQRAPVGIVLSSSGTSQFGMFDIQATTKCKYYDHIVLLYLESRRCRYRSIIFACFYLYVSVVNLIDYSDIDKMMDINNEKC